MLKPIADNIFAIAAVLIVGWFVWMRILGPKLAGVVNLSIEEYREQFHARPHTLLDVRSQGEFERGHSPKARHFAGDEIARDPAAVVASLPEGKPVICICAAGTRSAMAATVLAKAGVKPVYNLSGGMAAWQRAKLPMSRSK